MIPHLYRFRSIDAVLGSRHELENQEIYFASPEQLNDPIEGYKDIYWSGDHVVWRNLLKNYLLCLALSIPLCVGPDARLNDDDMRKIVFNTPNDLPAAPIRLVYKAVCDRFFLEPQIDAFLKAVSVRVTPIRRRELASYLQFMHGRALHFIIGELNHHGVPPIAIPDVPLKDLAKMVELSASDIAKAEEMFLLSELAAMQLALIHAYNAKIPPEAKVWEFLVRSFPAAYVRALDELVYPPWHAASFVANPTNAAMWGIYGDAHRGVCLKFKTSADGSGNPALPLYTLIGIRGGPRETENIYNYVPHTFRKVSYSE